MNEDEIGLLRERQDEIQEAKLIPERQKAKEIDQLRLKDFCKRIRDEPTLKKTYEKGLKEGAWRSITGFCIAIDGPLNYFVGIENCDPKGWGIQSGRKKRLLSKDIHNE